MDSSSQIRLAEVHPWICHLIYTLHDRMAADGIEIRVTQGLRSPAQQQALWLKGRDENGTVTDPSQIVTNAKPGHSWHSFGLAVDVVPMRDDKPDWKAEESIWDRIIERGEVLGLTSGSTFKHLCDKPHFQMTGRFPLSPTDEVRMLYEQGGLPAVWRAANIPAK